MQSSLTDITRANLRIDTLSLQLREAGRRETALRENNDAVVAKLAERDAEVGRIKRAARLLLHWPSMHLHQSSDVKRAVKGLQLALTPNEPKEQNDAQE